MEGNGELEMGRVYDLERGGQGLGKCIYIGKRVGDKVKFRYIIAGRIGEAIFNLAFTNYSLLDGKLIIRGQDSRRNPLNSSEINHLENILKRAGL